MRYCFIIFLFFALSAACFSQEHISFKHLSSDDGLSNNWVRCIYMDQVGFMWFGTADGLNKYDGHGFTVYRPRTTGGKSIGNINISCILNKNYHELWVGTDLGLYVYNYLEDELKPFPQFESVSFKCILQDSKNKFWFGTDRGLYFYDPQSNGIIHYGHETGNNRSIANNYVNVLEEDPNGYLWLGTKGGISRLDRSTMQFENFLPDDGITKYTSHDILSIILEGSRVWLADAQNGVFVFDRTTPDHPFAFRKIMSGQSIRLLLDSKRNLWIAKGSGEGLHRFNVNEYVPGKIPVIESFMHNPENQRSINDNSVFCLYQDRYQDIWIGTFGNGLNYYSPRAKKFYVMDEIPGNQKTIRHNLVNTFFEDDRWFYIGTEGGLDIMEKATGMITHYENETGNPNSMAANPVYSILKDTRNNLWVGTWAGGLHLFIPETKSFRHFLPDGKPGSISSANIFSILEDKAGNLWIGTIGGGLNRYDYHTGKFTVFRHDPDNPRSIGGDVVNHIYQTGNGKLYISLENSLELFDYQTETFTHFTHNVHDATSDYGNILSVYEDSKGKLWVATNAGLEYFNESDHTFTPVESQNQLNDNTIQGILEDDHGNFWISTNRGISKFTNAVNTGEEQVFINYSFEDGISGNEFKKRSAFKNKQGILFFGSSRGYTWFDPDSIQLNQIPPDVIISDFSILNAPGENEWKKLTRNVNYIDILKLPYKNADFEIRFSALNYLNPQNNHFKYKLEGYDQKWIMADQSQSARYTNLDHGTYTFLVMASNNDGVWSEAPKKLTIIILTPWWKTIAFKAIVAVVFVLLLFSSYKLRFKMLEIQKRSLEKTVRERTKELVRINELLEQKQEEITVQFEELSVYKNHLEHIVDERTAALRAAKDKAEESDRLKTAFLQNMSHEIRTPLNAIMGFSSLMDEAFDDRESLIKYAEIIRRKGIDLLDIISGILDISKIESGSLTINPEECNLDKLFEELSVFFQEFQQRWNKEHISFRLFVKGAVPSVISLDKGKLKQILINLVGNAFKFTREGTIEVCCELKGSNHLLFQVTDTGIGIPENKIQVIFERFRQIDEFKYHEGTGLGLSISKGLVELLGGEIWVKSELSKGSTFSFTIPFYIEPGN